MVSSWNRRLGSWTKNWFHSVPSPNQCIQKWGLQCTVNLEQSAPVYFVDFKSTHQYETLLLLQVCVWLSKCGADTAWVYQPNGHRLQGWPVIGFWELSSCFSVFYLRVCWDQIKLSSWVKCLTFYSGLLVSAGDRDKTRESFCRQCLQTAQQLWY